MAKKAAKGDRSDPKQNKSLAIRQVLQKMPSASAKEIVEAVKAEFGHKVSTPMVYMIKTKANIKKGRKGKRGRGGKSNGVGKPSPMNSAATWVNAINIGKQLLNATGSVENATALLKAIAG
jgi:S-adenosylmethionine synthetase